MSHSARTSFDHNTSITFAAALSWFLIGGCDHGGDGGAAAAAAGGGGSGTVFASVTGLLEDTVAVFRLAAAGAFI